MFAVLQAVHQILLANESPRTFRFLRVPVLVQQEILANMSFIDLFLFSTLSEKTKRIVRNFWVWRQLKVVIVFRSDDIHILLPKDILQLKLRVCICPMPRLTTFFIKDSIDFGANCVKYKQDEVHQVLEIYWDNVIYGMETVGNLLFDLCPKTEISLHLCSKPMITMNPVIGWLKNKNVKKLKNLTVEGCLEGPIGVNIILKNFEILERLATHVEHDYPSNPTDIPSNLEFLYIAHSRQLKLNHFFHINAKINYLFESSFTSGELNDLLKKWIEGETNDRMEYFLCIPVGEIDKRRVLAGIDGVLQSRDLKRAYKLSQLQTLYVSGGFDVRRRHDGALATVRWRGGFEMIVWTD